MDPKDSGAGSESKAALSASPKAKRGANRPKNRHLIRWDPDKIELAFHALHWAAAKQGVNLPWDEAAKIVDDQTTGDALKQQLIKRRNKRVELGLKAPPPLPGRGRNSPMAPRRSILKSASGPDMARSSEKTVTQRGDFTKRKAGRPAKSEPNMSVKTGKVTKMRSKPRRSKQIAKKDLSDTEEEASPELDSDSESGNVYGSETPKRKTVRFKSPSPESEDEETEDAATDSDLDAEGEDEDLDKTPTKVKNGNYVFDDSYYAYPDWTDELEKGNDVSVRSSRVIKLPVPADQLRAFENQNTPHLAQARAFAARRPVVDSGSQTPGQVESQVDATAMQDRISQGVSLQRLLLDPPTTPRRSRPSKQARMHTRAAESSAEPEASTATNQNNGRSAGRDDGQGRATAATDADSTPRPTARKSPRSPASGAAQLTADSWADKEYRHQNVGIIGAADQPNARRRPINRLALQVAVGGGHAPVATTVPSYPLASATSMGDMPYQTPIDGRYNQVQNESHPFFNLGSNSMSFDLSDPLNHQGFHCSQSFQGSQGFNGDMLYSNGFDNTGFGDPISIGASIAAPVILPSQNDPFVPQAFDSGVPQGMILSSQTSFNIPQNPFAQQDPFTQQDHFPRASPFAQQNPFIQPNPFIQQNSFVQQDPFVQQHSLGFQPAAMTTAAPAIVPSQHSPVAQHNLSFRPIRLAVPASAILRSQNSPVAEQQSFDLSDTVSKQEGQSSLAFSYDEYLEMIQKANAAQRTALAGPLPAEAATLLAAPNAATDPVLPTTLGDNPHDAGRPHLTNSPTRLEQMVTTMDANGDAAELPSLACSDLLNPDSVLSAYLNFDSD